MLEAADQYEKALTYPTSNSKRRHIYLYLGKSYESSQRLEKSVEAYELAVLYDKKNWKRHRDLAGLYERVRLFKKAEHAYTKAIQLFPSEVTLYFSLGRTYRKMGLYSQAEQNLKRSLDLGYQMHLVNFELSRVFEGQGRFGAAAEACQRSLSPAPTPEEAGRFVYLSVLADRPALVDESLKELRAVEKNKESLAFYENMVELLRGSPLQVLQLKTPDPTLQRIIASLSLNN
jgi:tetratricopeptide (TPR) repeat protein